MKAKSSTQMERFFTRCLPTSFTLKTMFVHVSEREVFHQIVAFLPENATGIVSFFQDVQNLCFLENGLVFSKKILTFFFKFAKGGKYAVVDLSKLACLS